MQKENIKKVSRTMTCGDIHGSYKGLKQALERSNFDYENDILIQLGDVADGWPEVPECVEELLKIDNLVSIRGNHDEWTREWFMRGAAPNHWTQQGGQATIDAYIRTGLLMDDRHRDFFKNQVNFCVDNDNRVFVHGGFRSRKGIGHEEYQADYFWDRDLWNLAMLSDKHYITGTLEDNGLHGTRFMRHKEIYIGHTSTGFWKAKGHFREASDPNQVLNGHITVPMNRCNVWNMDTGGGFEGKVTIMDIDTKEYWQSDLCKDLYPNHKGR